MIKESIFYYKDALLITGSCSHEECWHTDQRGDGGCGETCATAYLIRAMGKFIQVTGELKHSDVIERAIYNCLNKEVHMTQREVVRTAGHKTDSVIMAKWIWTSEKLPTFNQFVFFRKQFSINASFENMECMITAERFYQLWINGEWVNQGPALGLPEEKSFDVYDINHLLKPGENVVAVLVNFDRDKKIGTDHTKWLTRHAHGWDPEAPFLNDMYHQEHYSFGKDPADWNHAGFNNDGW